MRGRILVLGLCAVMMAGCDRNPEDSPPAVTAARLIYDRDVEPLLATTCADCHSNPDDLHGAPDFLDLVPGDRYASLVSRKDFVSCDVENSLLLAKGHDPDHPGGALTAPQHERVERWLVEEAIERFSGVCNGPPPASGAGGMDAGTPVGPLTGLQALEQLGDCMTLEDWNAANMPLVAHQTALFNKQQVPCYSCHANGAGPNWMPDPGAGDADASIADAFEKMRRVYSIFKLVRWTVNDEDGSFKEIVPSNRWRDKGQDPGHPPYELEAQYQESIDAWFQTANGKWKAGLCTP
jgi:hypothetical protein